MKFFFKYLIHLLFSLFGFRVFGAAVEGLSVGTTDTKIRSESKRSLFISLSSYLTAKRLSNILQIIHCLFVEFGSSTFLLDVSCFITSYVTALCMLLYVNLVTEPMTPHRIAFISEISSVEMCILFLLFQSNSQQASVSGLCNFLCTVKWSNIKWEMFICSIWEVTLHKDVRFSVSFIFVGQTGFERSQNISL